MKSKKSDNPLLAGLFARLAADHDVAALAAKLEWQSKLHGQLDEFVKQCHELNEVTGRLIFEVTSASHILSGEEYGVKGRGLVVTVDGGGPYEDLEIIVPHSAVDDGPVNFCVYGIAGEAEVKAALMSGRNIQEVRDFVMDRALQLMKPGFKKSVLDTLERKNLDKAVGIRLGG